VFKATIGPKFAAGGEKELARRLCNRQPLVHPLLSLVPVAIYPIPLSLSISLSFPLPLSLSLTLTFPFPLAFAVSLPLSDDLELPLPGVPELALLAATAASQEKLADPLHIAHIAQT
jgi:hypothetical protein